LTLTAREAQIELPLIECEHRVIEEGLLLLTRPMVMTDRRHSLKRGDRLSKKERQTTASDWKKRDKLRFVLWVKSDSDIYYNKTSDKAATK
jgi:hypothetical protein